MTEHPDTACAHACPLTAAGAERRRFLSQSVLAAAALALAACGGGDATSPDDGGTVTGSATFRVSDYSTLAAVGGVALVTVGRTPVAIVRTAADSFVALSRVCPHEGTTVNVSSGGFTCPLHGARFSTTGTWLGGERTTNMRSVALSYDATAGTLTVG